MLAKRKSRSQEALQEASYHVHYERKSLQYLCSRLVDNPPDGGFDYAAVMDSFLVHARTLNHFLYGADRAVRLCNPGIVNPKDVIAEDFFRPTAAWQKRMGGRLTEQEIKDINLQVAHLSYSRTRKLRDDYPYQDICDRLIGTLEQFVKDAPPANLCEELRKDYPIYPYLGRRSFRI
jgi:hypothetical protein